MVCTTVLYWCFHVMDHGWNVLFFMREWWLCLTLSLLSTVIVLTIFNLARIS